MTTFHIITIFPNIFGSYFSEGIVKRAIDGGSIKVAAYDLRDYTTDKHKTVDDSPYGGGAGMVMKIEPLYRCLEDIKSKIGQNESSRTILFAAKGSKYNQQKAEDFRVYDHLIFICGRYEGVDERVAENLIDEEISIGDYVLTGGEIPAMVLVDSISRLIPGVLGNPMSLDSESHSEAELLDFPVYTRPEEFMGMKVPEVLLSGNHAEIEKWRAQMKKKK